MSISDLKFTEAEMAAKSVTALADRPALSAAEMKERLDSGDIRVRLNAVVDGVQAELTDLGTHRQQLMVFEAADANAVAAATAAHGTDGRFFAFFLNNGKMFFGNAATLQKAVNSGF